MHGVRTGFLGLKTEIELKEDGQYVDILTDDYIWDTFNAGLLHDIAKKLIDPELLRKYPITREEKAEIANHALKGALLVDATIRNPRIRDIVYHHHDCKDGEQRIYEKDGTGLPLGSFVISIADTFDAEITPRPYRDGVKTIGEALEELTKDGLPYNMIKIFGSRVLGDKEFMQRVYRGTCTENYFR